jgi:hypothetical protein
VPAFGRAKASGLTPRVPRTPPEVTVRPTARRAQLDVAMIVGTVVATILLVLFGGGSDGRLSWPVVGVLLLVTAAGSALTMGAVRRWGKAQIAELQRGYTTTTFTMGRFWISPAPDAPWTLGWVQWDWHATWVLRPNGKVVSSPSSDADPPGLYPSPRRENALELWTGHQWSGYLPRKTTDKKRVRYF